MMSSHPAIEQSAASLSEPRLSDTATDVVAGLSRSPKRIAPKYFYDRKGSALFDAITQLDEYYIPRVERAIYAKYGSAMCDVIGRGKAVIEPGAGSCAKIQWLLPELAPAVYVPMDISTAHLRDSAAVLRSRFPGLRVQPQGCDLTAGLQLSRDVCRSVDTAPPVFFYPGSSIGNFERYAAIRFLQQMRDQMTNDGGLLIGVDAKKDPDVLHAAYNDSAGITARFNKNVLDHLNELLGGNLSTDRFSHVAFYNDQRGRIEMHLRCRSTHSARLAGRQLEFDAGELIHTEHSYKYHPGEFIDLAGAAGFQLRQLWQDPRKWFSVLYFVPG